MWGWGKATHLALEGSIWPGIVVLQFTPSGMLIETPDEPVLLIGTQRDIELDGLRGITIVEAVHPCDLVGRSCYSIKIIERDAGLLDRIRRRADARYGKKVIVSGRP